MPEQILIVDDNMDNVELLRKRLQAVGYETIEGYDGEQAVNLTRERHPDLILLDVMMPKLDGFEVCEILKKDDSTRHIPILMLTAKREVPDKVKGFDLGADDYVTKPFNFQELLARVKSLLKVRREYRRQLEMERQKALDRLAEGVAHEVRNPVVSIGGFARRIIDELPDSDQKKKYAQIIVKETERLERMVKDIADFRNIPDGGRQAEDINGIIDDALLQVDQLLRQNQIQVNREYAPELPAVFVNRHNLLIALMQVMTNAIEAMGSNGTLTVVTSAVDSSGVLVEIIDNGRGIPAKDLESIFDPFFTTKMSGAGMGLPLVRKIIDDHQGTIRIESTVGKGTRVVISLPAAGGS
jgi:signal transduction histidine kinase